MEIFKLELTQAAIDAFEEQLGFGSDAKLYNIEGVLTGNIRYRLRPVADDCGGYIEGVLLDSADREIGYSPVSFTGLRGLFAWIVDGTSVGLEVVRTDLRLQALSM